MCLLEIVMNELRKNQNLHFDLQIHPTLLNSTYLHCQMTGFMYIYKGPKFLKCRIISLLEEYFLLYPIVIKTNIVTRFFLERFDCFLILKNDPENQKFAIFGDSVQC